MYKFEPHVASRVFDAVLAEANVSIRRGRVVRVDVDRAVSGTAVLRALHTDDGVVHRGTSFVDASYEGDVMALAGVAYTWGREPPSEYNEPWAGVRRQPEPLCPPVVQFQNPVPHTTASGALLPLITSDPAPPGGGDKTVQAYNYRLCLTQNKSNWLPVPPPDSTSVYSRPETWELLRRWVAVRAAAGSPVQLEEVLAIHPTLHGKV